MIINADYLLPHLREKMRLATRDAARHILCPDCGIRTKLYRLRDNRRKCSDCGLKFSVAKDQHKKRIEQYALLLVCFCLDFTAQKTTVITGLRYRLVTDTFRDFRILLAESRLVERERSLPQPACHLDELSSCSICRKISKNARQTLAVGVRSKDGKIILERFLVKARRKESGPKRVFGDLSSLYGGFIHHGVFHAFHSDTALPSDGLALFWSWAEEKLRSHRGINPNNMWYYLKELEWKYNHRHLKPQMQAMRMALQLPAALLAGGNIHRVLT